MVVLQDSFLVSLPKDDFFFAQWKVPAKTLLFKTELSIAFLSYKPFLPFHFLVCPLASRKNFADLLEEEIEDLARSVELVKEVVCKHTGTVQSNFSINCQNGEKAGQTVGHVHLHVLLRTEGDSDKSSSAHQKLCAEGYIFEERKPWSRDQLADLTSLLQKQLSILNKS